MPCNVYLEVQSGPAAGEGTYTLVVSPWTASSVGGGDGSWFTWLVLLLLLGGGGYYAYLVKQGTRTVSGDVAAFKGALGSVAEKAAALRPGAKKEHTRVTDSDNMVAPLSASMYSAMNV